MTQLKVLYYNTFLSRKVGEGMVSRQFLAAAVKLDEWQLTTIPKPSVSDPSQNNHKKPESPIRMRLKQIMPASFRKTVRQLQSPKNRIPISSYRYTRRMTDQLSKVIRGKGPFDVLLLHLSQRDLETVARLCRTKKTPIVLRVPGPLAYQADHVFHRYMSLRDRENERYLYEIADAITVISTEMKQLLVNEGVEPTKIYPIPNGLNFNNFTPNCADGSLMRQKLNLTDRKIVGYVGGYWPGNDIHTLLHAWKSVEQKEPMATLLLVGDGPQRAEAEALSLELNLQNCVWVGQVEHSQVPHYMSAMDIGVGPYTAKALAFISPLKIIEYTSMGLPVVATKGGQIAELIEHGTTGFLYSSGSSQDLADCLITLLRSPEMAREMGKRAAQRIQNWKSWDNVAEDVLTICKNVVH